MADIVLNNVCKTIQGRQIIRNVQLDLHAGYVYGLQGYNGSGKTMLMRLVSGLIKPTAGQIMIDGKILGKEYDFPPSIGVLIENPAFLNSYTGYQNLKLIADIQGTVKKAKIEQTLVRVGLDPHDKRKYKKYSLGMKQRLGIAAAIMEKPQILVLDEPTNALDKDGIATVMKIIEEERSRGALIILSCHESNWLQEASDVIYTIENGAITHQEEIQKNGDNCHE